MKRTITIIGAVAGVLFFTSCKRESSVNVDQNRIYTEYEFMYDAGTNVSTFNARFRLDNSGGQKLELAYPSRVDFNGDGLSWKQAMGQYKTTRAGLISQGAFNFFDVQETHYSNPIPQINPIDIPIGMNTISQSGNFFLPWIGAPLQQGETITVRISGAESGGSQTFTISQVGASHIILEQHRLDNLGIGTAQIEIERSVSSYLTESNLAGGRMEATYKSRKVNVNIVG